MIDYTALVRQVIADASKRVPALAHIDASRVAVMAASRGGLGRTGNLALCYGLRGRFDEAESAACDTGADGCGEPVFTLWVRGRRSRRAVAVSGWFLHRWPRVMRAGRECRYLIALRMPRMLTHAPLETIFHELHHIGRGFDGRLSPERHGAPFDRAVKYLAGQWRECGDPELVRRASMRLDELEAEFGAVVAECAPAHFTMPLVEAADAPEPYETAIARLHPGFTLARSYEVVAPKTSRAAAPRLIDEGALRLRHVTREGTAALPRALAKYARIEVAS